MSRYIDADNLAREFERHPDRWYFGRDVLREIGEASDAIVRCGECGKFGSWTVCPYYAWTGDYPDKDWYCANGEKKEDNNEAD